MKVMKENETGLVPETNMEIAYDRYYDIVRIGIKNMHPAEFSHFTKSGGEALIVKSLTETDDLPYFMVVSEGYGIEKHRLGLGSKFGLRVIASAIIDAGCTMSDLLHFLPDYLANNAICTAGMPHKFRGGVRKGAGRKPTHPLMKKDPISIKLPRWVLEWLDQQTESRAVIIEDALRSKHDIEPPNCRPIDD
jgi:hypothetical protein